MAFKSYTLTLGAAAARLSSVLTTPASNADTDLDYPVAGLILQADGGNGNPIYVGSDSGVTAAGIHAFSIPAGAAGVPVAPIIIGDSSPIPKIRLGDVWVIGTAGQKLHIGTIPF